MSYLDFIFDAWLSIWPSLRFLIICAIILIVPGLCLQSIFKIRKNNILAKLAFAFALSYSLWSILGGILLMLEKNLALFQNIALASITILCLVSAILYLWRSARPQPSDSSKPQQQTQVSMMIGSFIGLLFIISICVWAYTTASAPQPGSDHYVYQAFLRHYLDTDQFYDKGLYLAEDHDRFTPRLKIQAWLLVQALTTQLSQVEMAISYQYYWPPLLMALSLTFFYIFLGRIFSNYGTAIIICYVQVLGYLTDLKIFGENTGYSFFTRIIEDKHLVRFILLPLAYWITFSYLQNRDKKHLFSLFIVLGGFVFTHALGLPFYAITIGSYAVISLYLNYSRERLIQYLSILACIIPWMIVPIWQVLFSPSTVVDINQGTSTFNSGLNEARLAKFIFLDVSKRFYVLDPELLWQPLSLLALLLTPLLLIWQRHSNGVRFLIATLLGTLAICFIPVLTPIVGRLISPWMLPRVLWLLPTNLIIGYILHKAFELFFGQKSSLIPVGLSLILILLTGLGFRSNIQRNLSTLQSTAIRRSLTNSDRSALSHLRDNGIHGSTILAHTNNQNNFMPSLVGHSYGITFRQSNLNNPNFLTAKTDRQNFYRSRFLTTTQIDILNQYGIRYILMPNSSELNSYLKKFGHAFSIVYQNDEYNIYEWLPERFTHQDKVLTDKFQLLQQRKLIDALEAFKTGQSDKESLYLSTLLGIGQVYTASSQNDKAISIYQNVIDNESDDPWHHVYLARSYSAKQRQTKDDTYLDKAIRSYIQALQLSPNNNQIQPELVKLIGRFPTSTASEQLNILFNLYEMEIESNPKNYKPYVQLADLYKAFGYLEKAQFVLQQAKIQFIRPEIQISLAENYLLQGDANQAISVYRNAIRLQPDSEDGYIGLSNLYLQFGNLEEALATYQLAIDNNPEESWPHLQAGKLYFRR